MSITFITDMQAGEDNILIGREHAPLTLKDEAGEIITVMYPPEGGWTHMGLEALSMELDEIWCADAYLGEVWIGSTEI